MAYSTQRAVSDGTLTYLDLSITYQSRNDIKVFMNDLPAAPGSWAWVGTTDKRISFTPAVPNGVEVLVQRTTRLDRIINVFSKGAKFTNVTMDMNFEQVLMLTQEAVEGSALSDIYNDVDFHGYKIKNLGLAVADNDAITFGQVKTLGNGAYQAQLAAEAARDLAQLWATKLTTTVDGTDYSAKQYALNAGGSASQAAASATAANTSAINAASSAAASQTSRLASEAARAGAESARDDAVGAAAPATALYDRMDAVEDVADAATATANAAAVVANNLRRGDTRIWANGITQTLNVRRYKTGRYLWINGKNEVIPAGGMTLTAVGLASNTLHYIYAYMVGSTMTLLASTTPYALDAEGWAIFPANPARTFIGIARTAGIDASNPTVPAWYWTAQFRYICNWFNREMAWSRGERITANWAGATPTEINGTTRAYVCGFAGDAVTHHLQCTVRNLDAAATMGSVTAMVPVGASAAPTDSTLGEGQATATGANLWVNTSATAAASLPADGVYALVALSWVNTGLGAFTHMNVATASM